MAKKPFPFKVCEQCCDGSGSGGGADGLSAYEIALNNGFEGTEQEWLESLHGKDGDTPQKGVDYFTPEDKAELVTEVTEEITPTLNTKADKPIIITDTESTAYNIDFLERHNHVMRLGELVNLSFTFSNGEYPEDYGLDLSFDSGATPTTISYSASGIINWVGTDCSTVDGLSIFQPSANTHYDIIFYYNGNQFIGLVNGYVPASGNVVSE